MISGFRSHDVEDMDEIEYMKELQAKFDKEEEKLDPYNSLVKQYSSEKEAQGVKLGPDDWICEICDKINKIPEYKCEK